MIVPCIDLMEGRVVQLVGGRKKALDAGDDPMALAERFAVVGEISLVDLDAALGRGTNAETLRRVVARFPCRIGGGIRDAEAARAWLDAGARRVVLGTAAVPEVLRELPTERVIAALDAIDGEVVVEGWQRRTGRGVLERMAELREEGVGGFLVTFVEGEGRMGGLDLARAEEIVAAAAGIPVTFAGGIRSAEEVAALDRLGADAIVGMALYTGRLPLEEAFAAPLVSDRPDGLWPTVVVDESDKALGLAYSDRESLFEALRNRRGVYHSRKRGLWWKGASSGQTQELLSVAADCDRDALRFTVRQQGGGFCHRGTRSCWGGDRGLTELLRRLGARVDEAPTGSYTRRLLDDPALLAAKLREEAGELAEAGTRDQVVWEAADLAYFLLVAMARAGVGLPEVEAELDRRARKLVRRPGDAKPGAGGGRAERC